MRRTIQRGSKQLIVVLLLLSGISGAVGSPVLPEKMKPEEVVAKHLASIGTPADFAALKTRVMIGEVVGRLKLGTVLREVSGPAQFASDGNKVLLAMAFNSSNYPGDKAGFDGEKVTVAQLPTGGRSPLANFLSSQDAILRQGLLGGTLSSAWSLFKLDPKEVKLSYSGTEKINGRETHELKYQPKKGDLKISLYFDAETFQHVRTKYEYSISARMGNKPGEITGPATSTGGVSRYQLFEDFSDFKPVGKLNLPHTYKVHLFNEGQAQNMEYTITLAQFVFDQPIDPESFNVAGKPS